MELAKILKSFFSNPQKYIFICHFIIIYIVFEIWFIWNHGIYGKLEYNSMLLSLKLVCHVFK